MGEMGSPHMGKRGVGVTQKGASVPRRSVMRAPFCPKRRRRALARETSRKRRMRKKLTPPIGFQNASHMLRMYQPPAKRPTVRRSDQMRNEKHMQRQQLRTHERRGRGATSGFAPFAALRAHSAPPPDAGSGPALRRRSSPISDGLGEGRRDALIVGRTKGE